MSARHFGAAARAAVDVPRALQFENLRADAVAMSLIVAPVTMLCCGVAGDRVPTGCRLLIRSGPIAAVGGSD